MGEAVCKNAGVPNGKARETSQSNWMCGNWCDVRKQGPVSEAAQTQEYELHGALVFMCMNLSLAHDL